mmetsp:Transcript_13711/g.37925  ORF Transcript_13711/g.37925 Transcript_13711/m.37925 type:complete len:219 (-) Transcript_13711:250-906(-)
MGERLERHVNVSSSKFITLLLFSSQSVCDRYSFWVLLDELIHFSFEQNVVLKTIYAQYGDLGVIFSQQDLEYLKQWSNACTTSDKSNMRPSSQYFWTGMHDTLTLYLCFKGITRLQTTEIGANAATRLVWVGLDEQIKGAFFRGMRNRAVGFGKDFLIILATIIFHVFLAFVADRDACRNQRVPSQVFSSFKAHRENVGIWTDAGVVQNRIPLLHFGW